MRSRNIRVTIFILGMFFLGACAPADKPEYPAPTSTPLPAATAAPKAALPAAAPTATALPYLIKQEDFSNAPDFCAPEPEKSQFQLSCLDGALNISQAENRRGMDIYLLREVPARSRGFILDADVTSQSAVIDRFDQNQFGFIFTTTDGTIHALRIEGQYFNFEEWSQVDPVEVTNRYNSAFAPAILSAGRKNHIRLICDSESCHAYANNEEIGHAPFGTENGVSALGFFTASDWDQQFGTVTLNNLTVTELPVNWPELQTFALYDDLTNDRGTFSQMGLSGAFSEFESDGFHFSPVIPYGYYSAKAGPALQNMSVKAIINMLFDPGVRATQYAGVVCRSSLNGMVIAIIRVDATYTIYRDSKRRPFAMLAKDQIDTIQAGRSDVEIQLDCIDDSISLSIDGEQVETLTDNRYDIRFGRAGIFTKAGGVAFSDAIIFSDFSINEKR